MDTQHHHNDEAGERMRSAGRGTVALEAASNGSSAATGSFYTTRQQPTARQIADALVRWIATGSRR